MIDNVVLIVTGSLHERDVQELLEKCHPLGMCMPHNQTKIYSSKNTYLDIPSLFVLDAFRPVGWSLFYVQNAKFGLFN